MSNYNLLNKGLDNLTDYEVISYLVASHMKFKTSTRAPSLEEITNTLKSL